MAALASAVAMWAMAALASAVAMWAMAALASAVVVWGDGGAGVLSSSVGRWRRWRAQ